MVDHVELIAEQILPVQTPVNRQGLTQQPRATGLPGNPLHRLHGPDQDCRGMAFRLGDHVHAAVHPVDQVDIGIAGRPKHRLRANRTPPARMRSLVMRANIGLDFNNTSDARTSRQDMHQIGAQQFPRDGHRVALVKGSRQHAHGFRRR